MGATTWADLMVNPHLKDLPFKIELNGRGKIEMAPASNERGAIRAQISMELAGRSGGQTLLGAVVQTAEGVRVADVAWISAHRLKRLGLVTPFQLAPEVCVDVMETASAWSEMELRAEWYLAAGAEEVWIVGLDGARRVIRN